jgi:hypothetical protein
MPFTCALSPATAEAIEVIGATVVATTSPPEGADELEAEVAAFEPQAANITANNGTTTATDFFTPTVYSHFHATAKDMQ